MTRYHTSMPPLIRASSVSREFVLGQERVQAVRSVSMELAPGRFVLIRGKSGSGKTTLLNLLGGLDRPTSGAVYYHERDLHHFSEREMTRWRRTKAAFIFQAFALIPGLTAAENVDLPLRIAGAGPRAAGQRALHYLDLVGLAPRAHHRIYELSGGEQQRVAIARALVKEPELLLADEPTGELDQTTGHGVLALLRGMARERNIAACVTSHDPTAADFADEVYGMRDGILSAERRAA